MQGLILAGGASTRFHGNKARHQVDGDAMVSRVAQRMKEAGLEVAMVVRDRFLEDLGWPLWVEPRSNDRYPLRAMLWALEQIPEGSGAVFAPCDMPFLTATDFRALRTARAPAVAWDGENVQPLLVHLEKQQLSLLRESVQDSRSALRFVRGFERLSLERRHLRNINRPEDLDSV